MANFKDLGMKVAQNKQLTPQELQDWGRFLVAIERSNSVIGSFVGPDNKENIVPKFPGARVRLVNTSINNNSLTTGIWTVEDYDDATFWDSTDNTKLYFRTGGVYVVTGLTVWATNATGIRASIFQIDGGGGVYDTVGAQNALSGVQTPNTISTEITVSSGSYATISFLQTSGGALSIEGATFAARLLR